MRPYQAERDHITLLCRLNLSRTRVVAFHVFPGWAVSRDVTGSVKLTYALNLDELVRVLFEGHDLHAKRLEHDLSGCSTPDGGDASVELADARSPR